MNRRARLLTAMSADGAELGDPPADITADELEAWHAIVAATPTGVLRAMDEPYLRTLAQYLTDWRAHPSADRSEIRELYRSLGQCFIPMRNRRRILFPHLRQFLQ